MDFKNKTVLVIGATSDIGGEIVKKFASLGSNVIIHYNKNREKADVLSEQISKYKIEKLIVKADITSEDEIKIMVDNVVNRFNKIDILINCSAIYADNRIEDKSKKEFMDVLEVNVVGTFLVCKYISNYMNNGYIINISSTDGIDTFNEYNIDYSVSKAGVNMLTKCLAYSLKNNKVYAIAPNWVNTTSTNEMNRDFLSSELKRIGQKELIEVDEIINKIIKIIANDIETGSIIRIDKR